MKSLVAKVVDGEDANKVLESFLGSLFSTPSITVSILVLQHAIQQNILGTTQRNSTKPSVVTAGDVKYQVSYKDDVAVISGDSIETIKTALSVYGIRYKA